MQPEAGQVSDIRWLLRMMAVPWVTLIMLVALALDASSLPSESTVGRWFSRPKSMGLVDDPAITIFEAADGHFVVVTHSFGPTTHPRLAGTSQLAYVKLQGHWAKKGFWAATTYEADPVVSIWPMGRPLTAADNRAIFSQFENCLNEQESDLAPLVAASGKHVTRMRGDGVIHDILTGCLLLLLLISMGWIPRMLSERRMRSAVRQECCPNCSYDLRSNFEAGCPECGWRRG